MRVWSKSLVQTVIPARSINLKYFVYHFTAVNNSLTLGLRAAVAFVIEVCMVPCRWNRPHDWMSRIASSSWSGSTTVEPIPPKKRTAIYKLRYEAYLREGAISPNPTGQFTDWWTILRTSGCSVSTSMARLASSIRLSVALPECGYIPALDVFGDVLTPMPSSASV